MSVISEKSEKSQMSQKSSKSELRAQDNAPSRVKEKMVTLCFVVNDQNKTYSTQCHITESLREVMKTIQDLSSYECYFKGVKISPSLRIYDLGTHPYSPVKIELRKSKQLIPKKQEKGVIEMVQEKEIIKKANDLREVGDFKDIKMPKQGNQMKELEVTKPANNEMSTNQEADKNISKEVSEILNAKEHKVIKL